MRLLPRIVAVLITLNAPAFTAFCAETYSYRAGTRPETWWNTPSVWGQEQWNIGLAINSMYGGNLERGSPMGIGAQLGYRFFDIYSLCLGLDNYRAKDEDNDRDDFNVIAGVMSFRAHLTIADSFPGFYGGAGAGIYSFDAPDNSSRWLFHALFGIEYAAFHPFCLFAEYRYTFHNFSFDDSDDHGLFRVGGNYAF